MKNIEINDTKDFRKIGVVGKVTITNGDIVIIEKESNAIVRQGLRHIAATLAMQRIRVTGYDPSYLYFGSYAATIKFGKGSVTPTVWDHDNLISTITLNASSGTQNAIAQTGSDNYYYTIYTTSWNSGTLNAQLGIDEQLTELGLYLNLLNDTAAGWNKQLICPPSQAITYTYPLALFSRISLGTSAFIPDENKPVSVEWEIGVEFI